MAAIVPPVYLPAPAPAPLRYGLFAAARGPLDIPAHASVGGIEFEPDTCGIAHAYTASCPPTVPAQKTFDGASVVTSEPYVVYASELCAPIGRTPQEASRRALARLLGGEQTVVEAALWDGAGVGASPTLTDSNATVVSTPALSFAGRLGALEAAFYAAYGYQGTIHANTALAETAAYEKDIIRDGNRMLTDLGSVWSFGAGYGLTGPGGAAPATGSAWIFMTPPVTIWRAPTPLTPDPAQTFDHINNGLYSIAEREYVHALDCDLVFAIQVPLESAGDADTTPVTPAGSVSTDVQATV